MPLVYSSDKVSRLIEIFTLDELGEKFLGTVVCLVEKLDQEKKQRLLMHLSSTKLASANTSEMKTHELDMRIFYLATFYLVFKKSKENDSDADLAKRMLENIFGGKNNSMLYQKLTQAFSGVTFPKFPRIIESSDSDSDVFDFTKPLKLAEVLPSHSSDQSSSPRLPINENINKVADVLERLRALDKSSLEKHEKNSADFVKTHAAKAESKIEMGMQAKDMLKELFSLVGKLSLEEKIADLLNKKLYLIRPSSDLTIYGLSFAKEMESETISPQHFFISMWGVLQDYTDKILKLKPDSVVVKAVNAEVLDNTKLVRFATKLTALGYKPLNYAPVAFKEFSSRSSSVFPYIKPPVNPATSSKDVNSTKDQVSLPSIKNKK